MAWDEAPPTPAELQAVQKPAWDANPPTPEELKAANEGGLMNELDAIGARPIGTPGSWGGVTSIDRLSKDAASQMGPALIGNAAIPLAKGAGLLGRIAMGAATGGAIGGSKEPKPGETKLGNTARGAEIGGTIGSIIEASSPLLSAIKNGAIWAGGKLAGVKDPELAEIFAKNPELADEMYRINKDNPGELTDQARESIQTSTGNLRENSTNPALDKLGKAIVGKNFAVKPSQYQGTAVENEIKHAYDAQGNNIPLNVPMSEVHDVLMTPVEAKMSYGPSQTQSFQHGPEFGYENPTAEVSAITRKIEKSGPDKSLGQVLIPKGSQEVSIPTPMPDKVSMTGPQILRAKRAASQAADFNQSKNPLGYRASDDAEAAAAGNLRSALRNQSPQIDDLNELIEKNIRLSNIAKGLNNPAQIYSSSESVGSVPIRTLQQYLDENTGSNFQELGDALSAGKAVNGVRSDRLLEGLVANPVGRAILRRAGTPISIEQVQPQLINELSGGNDSKASGTTRAVQRRMGSVKQ